jgi:magnesium chelatase family protein
MPKNSARLYSAELVGIDAKIIEVEADVNVGLHDFTIVGLGDRSLTEAKERVNSAIKNSGIKPPNRENRRITINLAPADVRKTGSQYDLAIAIGYLLATAQIKKFDAEKIIFMGELALDGRLRPIAGALNIAQKAANLNFDYLFLPRENANEAAAISTIAVIALNTLSDAINILEGRAPRKPHSAPAKGGTKESQDGTRNPRRTEKSSAPDFSEISGQENAKRALVIAACGAHNVLLTGPPGVGKSFLARAFGGIMPHLTDSEAIEATKIWSAAGLQPDGLLVERPFRAPHHTASLIALIGGGQDSRPGEISLAHRGILFLDELPEFQRGALEALRQPIESGEVHIARAKHKLIFPSQFTLVAAMNPCPCGYYGDSERECSCTAFEVMRYQKKISGPLLDRIDLHVKIGRIAIQELRNAGDDELVNERLRRRVEQVREIQQERFHADKTNAEMSSRETRAMVAMTPGAERFLEALEKTRLSPRSYFRLLKVARTIADLEGKEEVGEEFLAEAFSYRLRKD